jgi:adenylate kinase
MKIVLLGAPGAGKGTQASAICQMFNIVHISTGDIFRKNIKEQTEIGLIAKSYIDKGNLVPDEVTIEIVRQRILQEDCKHGYLLDGFPRNINQAEKLMEKDEIDWCINLDVPQEKLVARLTGRRVCSKCGKSFHIDFLNGKTTCDACGETLSHRSDDHVEQVEERLKVYNEQTQPLIGYYTKCGKLLNIDADGSIDEVGERIKKALK